MPELSNDPIIPEIPDLPPDPHILDYFALVARHKWMTMFLVLFSGAVFFIGSYCVPYEFQSEAMLLPPDRLSSSSLLSGASSGYAIKMLKEVENPSVDLLQNILESHSLGARVAEDSVIRAYYRPHVRTEEELVATLQRAIEVGPSFTKVRVRTTVATGWFSSAREKEKARLLPSRIDSLAVWVMDSLLKSEFRVSSHIIRRYADSDYAVRSAELDSLDMLQEKFEQEHGIDSLPLQTKETIAQMARLEASRDEAQMNLNLLSRDLSPHDPRYQAASAEAEGAERAAREYVTTSKIGPSLAELPEVSRAYAEILRRKTTLEPIVSYLRKESEQERINEEREKSIITLLDPPRVPEIRSSPKRLPMLLIGLSGGMGLAILYIAIVSFFESSKIRWQAMEVGNA
jgi:uncharacterized protein involved in exopolysaccharide biosynthesis